LKKILFSIFFLSSIFLSDTSFLRKNQLVYSKENIKNNSNLVESWKRKKKIKEILVFQDPIITTYNPSRFQTDRTPCVNPSSFYKLKRKYWEGNLCNLYKKGYKIVALPQDRLKYVYSYLWQSLPKNKILFSPWDKIRLKWFKESLCNWLFIIWDAFSSKYNGKEKVDIFLLDSKKNTRCIWGEMYKILM